MIAALLVVSLPPLQQPIDFQPDVASVPTLVQLLAKKTGLKMTTSKNVANDIVGIVAPHASPKEIMDKIAFAIEAEWLESGGQWTLARTEAQTRAQEANDRTVTIARLQKELDKLPKDEPFQEADARSIRSQVEAFEKQHTRNSAFGKEFTDLQGKMPSYRLLARILRQVPLESLANLSFGSRHVFTLNPNRLQKKIPESAAPGIDQFLKENNLLGTFWPDTEEPSVFYFDRPKDVNGPIKVILSITRSALQGFEIGLKGFSANGSGVFQIRKDLQSEFDGDNFTPGKLDASDTLVELRPLSKKLLDYAISTMRGSPGIAPAELRARFTHPLADEPMAVVNTEGIQAVSKALGKPIVALLPEPQIFVALSMAQDGKLTVKRYLAGLDAMGVIREEKDGWITYRDRNPVMGRRRRVDRKAIDDYFRRIEHDKRMGLDNFADFVLRYPGRLEDTMFPILMLLMGSYPANFQFQDDLDIVRLYGTLTKQQKEALRRGATFTITDFSPDQQALAAAIVYGKNDGAFSAVAYSPSEQNSPSGSIETEPTEVFPNGLTDPFSLKATVRDKPSWFRKEIWGETRPTDAGGIAWQLFQSERPDIFPWMTQGGIQRGGAETYVNGQANSWDFTIAVSKRLTRNASLTDHTVPDGPLVKFADLPQAFRDEITKQLESLRTQYKDTKPGEFGGRTSPPPPH